MLIQNGNNGTRPLEYLASRMEHWKPKVDAYKVKFLRGRKDRFEKDLKDVIYTEDFWPYFEKYETSSKNIRSTLLMEVYSGYGGADEPRAISPAAASEFLQDGSLVADDIIDGDLKRRGIPSMHKKFADIYVEHQFSDHAKNDKDYLENFDEMNMKAANYGVSKAIAMAHNLSSMSGLALTAVPLYGASQEIYKLHQNAYNKLTAGVSSEIDSSLDRKHRLENLTRNSWKKINENKTHPLLEFPVVTGALMAMYGRNDKITPRDENDIKSLKKVTKTLSTAFQETDDLLMYSDNQEKQPWRDVLNARPNIALIYLYEDLKEKGGDDLKIFHEIVGNEKSTMDDCYKIIDMSVDMGIDKRVRKDLTDDLDTARVEYYELHPAESEEGNFHKLMEGLIEYLPKRQK